MGEQVMLVGGQDVVFLILGIVMVLGSGCVCVTCCSAFRGRREEEKWIPAPEYAPKALHSNSKNPYKGLPPPRNSERFRARTKLNLGRKGSPPDEKWRKSQEKLKTAKPLQRIATLPHNATRDAPPEVATVSGSYRARPPEYTAVEMGPQGNGHRRY